MKDSSGWQQVFMSPHIDNCIERIAINANKINNQSGNSDGSSVMVAISYGNQVRLWGVSEQGSRTNIGNTYTIQNEYEVTLKIIIFRYI